MRAVILALLALLAVASAQSLYRVKTFSYTGGFPGCTSCGSPDGQFSCSNLPNSWKDGVQKFSVQDVPSGYQLTEVSVSFTGTYNCANSGVTLVNVTLNGIIVDAITVTGNNQCKCGSCDGERIVTNKFYKSGFPLFRYWDTNILRIDRTNGNDMCLSQSFINMTFTKPSFKSAFVIASSNSTGPSTNACTRATTTACLNPGDFTVSTSNGCCWNYLTMSFVDPIGSKGRVVAINALVYANTGSKNQNRNLEVRVADQVITSYKIPSSVSCGQCTGAITFTNPTPYMMGWPNYRYGSANDVQVSIRSSDYVYEFMVGQVVLELVYV